MKQGKTKSISTIFGLRDVVAIFFLFIGMGFFVFPHTVFAELNDDSYRGILHETIRFYNFFTDEKISPEQEAWMAWGVRHEGIPSRATRHDSIEAMRAWVHDARAQSDYIYEGVYTWEQGIVDYARGDEQRAFEVLGHLLRLVFTPASIDDASAEGVGTALRAEGATPTTLSTVDEAIGVSEGDILTTLPNAAGVLQLFLSEVRVQKRIAPEDVQPKKIQNIFSQIAVWTQRTVTIVKSASQTFFASIPQFPSFSFGRDAVAIDHPLVTVAATDPPPSSEPLTPLLVPSLQPETVTPPLPKETPPLPLAQSMPVEMIVLASPSELVGSSDPTAMPNDGAEPPPPAVFQQAGEVVSLPPSPSIELPPPLPQTDYLGFPVGYVPHSSSDRTPPETAITVSPDALTTTVDAEFSFDATEQSTFFCALDGGASMECVSPYTYTNLAVGEHSFSVAARDSAGNDDITPATFTWTIQEEVQAPAPEPVGSSDPTAPSDDGAEPEAPPAPEMPPEPPPAPEPEVPPEPEPEPPPPAVAIIKITEAHFQGNASVEYMVITNQGSAAQELLGWKLHDIVATPSHTYTFGAFTLTAGASVTVHTGAGTNTQTDLYWNSNISIWNDTGGDTAFLKDSGGTLIDSVTWP